MSTPRVEWFQTTSVWLSPVIKDLLKLWPWLRQNRRLVLIAVLLVPFVSMMQAALPLVLKATIDQGVIPGDIRFLLLMGLAYATAVILEYAGRIGQTLAASSAVHKMIRSMRESVIQHVLRLSASFHDRSMSGALVTRATSEFDNLSESLNQGVLTAVVDLAVLAGCMIGMLVLDWRLALTAFLMLPLLVIVVKNFSRILRESMLAARKMLATLNAYTQECLYGSSAVKLLNATADATSRYKQLNEKYRSAQMRSVIVDATMFAILDGFSAMTTGIVLWIAVRHLAPADFLTSNSTETAISAGVLVAFIQYVQQLFEPLKQLGNKMAMLQGAFTSIERIFTLLETDEKISGSEDYHCQGGQVEFKNVFFGYGKNDVLKDINLTIPPGTTLALVGPTGSGKSTIIKLIAKLYDGYRGHILLDGKELKSLDPRSLRTKIAIVPQDITLFDGTLRFNIGLDREGITDSSIQKALKSVCADDFLTGLPGGLDFKIREQGANLSHGQRQLIVFARAVASDPALLILDEATSSIDPESEIRVQKATEALLHNRTVIVIAHRLSTVERCDQILLVKDGEILERGSHDQLMGADKEYRKLHDQPGAFIAQSAQSSRSKQSE